MRFFAKQNYNALALSTLRVSPPKGEKKCNAVLILGF